MQRRDRLLLVEPSGRGGGVACGQQTVSILEKSSRKCPNTATISGMQSLQPVALIKNGN
jgi:hypothetical protein